MRARKVRSFLSGQRASPFQPVIQTLNISWTCRAEIMYAACSLYELVYFLLAVCDIL